MDLSQLKYNKSEPAKEELIAHEELEVGQTEKISTESATLKEEQKGNVGLEYVKQEGELSPALFFVLSGGTKREHDFLQTLEKKRRLLSLRVLFLSSARNAGGLTPNMMLAKWQQICAEGKFLIDGTVHQLLDIDKVFLFTDVDHYEDELRKILSSDPLDSEQWIISNPDFEIWIYYCFRSDPANDLAELLSLPQSQRSSKLKYLNGTFNMNGASGKGGGLDPRKAFDHIRQGIEHSKDHYQEDIHHIPTLFSTQMHLFAEEVLEKADTEFDRYIQNKSNRAKEFLRLKS